MLKTLLARLVRSARSEKAARARLQGSLAEEAAGYLEAAETGYRELLASQPDRADLCGLLGNNLVRQRRVEEAVHWLARATHIDANVPEAHYMLGGALSSLGRHEEAVRALRAALALRSDFPAALNCLANTLMVAGRRAEAEVAYLQAHALQPEIGRAHV